MSSTCVSTYVIYTLIFTINILTYQTQASKLPKTWKTCRISDPNMKACLKDAIEDAVHDLANGNPSLGILPMDPLHFNKISIDQGSGPVSIKLDLIDLDVIGIKNVKLTTIKKFDWKEGELEGIVPGKLVLDGKYKIDGKVLVLPIKGDGHCRITADNFKMEVKAKVKNVDKKGKVHYEITVFDFDFTVDKLHFQFDNLFNGDKALGDNMNVFLNENWKEIITELKPAIVQAFGTAFRNIGNIVFSKVPADQISPP
ncbi:hypothetical protein O3M35_010988 [Rhynocoris fuscipes]|uniref:Uncharacterized protein n=1 Tax=Rhynocoris fuscipes TaxID=488301 RepID=A0AAW1D1Z3_9HEMI